MNRAFFSRLIGFVLCCSASCLFGAEEPEGKADSRLLFASMLRVSRELNSCHLVIACRKEDREVQNGVEKQKKVRTVHCDLWVNGDAVQCRELAPTGSASQRAWWEGSNWGGSPYSRSTLLERIAPPGYLRVFDDNHSPKFVTFTPNVLSEALHVGVYDKKPIPSAITSGYAPYIGFGRKWKTALTTVDRFLVKGDVGIWDMLGEETYRGIQCIKTKVRRSTREFACKDGQTLSVSPVHYFWFAKSDDYRLVSMFTSIEYGFSGTWYPLREESGDLSFSEKCDFTDPVIFRGISYPRNGVQVFRTPANDGRVFDPNLILKGLKDNQFWTNRYRSFTETIAEWKVLELESLDPSTDLWIDPPDGSLVVDNGVSRIQGMSVEESRRQLGGVPSAKTDSIRPISDSSSFILSRNTLFAINVLFISVFAYFIYRRARAG